LDLTEGTLLGGRVQYAQPRDGYRTGIEPVLLAAAIPARAGQHVLEAGTGAGAGLLCLLARVPGVHATGVEQDALLAELAGENVRRNGFEAGRAVTGDILAGGPEEFDHAMANPPWHDARSTAPAHPRRVTAKQADAGLLGGWLAALWPRLRPGGTLTLALPVAALEAAAGAMERTGFGAVALFPLWPREGCPARLMLLRAVKGRRGDSRILPGLVLHDGDGYSSRARQVLWEGAPILF
jgi:tRNA1Val (adenine37-N6)-methyltransferase